MTKIFKLNHDEIINGYIIIFGLISGVACGLIFGLTCGWIIRSFIL